MVEQSHECSEEHKALSNRLSEFEAKFNEMCKNCADTHSRLFGGLNQLDGQLSFIDKVTVIQEKQEEILKQLAENKQQQENNRKFIQNCVVGLVVVVLSAFITVGQKSQQLENNTNKVNEHSQQITTLLSDVAALKVKCR